MKENTQQFRHEEDVVGIGDVPVDAYYGIQSYRAKENFPITGHGLHPELIRALAEIKKACAIANAKAGELTPEVADAICQAADDVIAGKLDDAFITDAIQGGAGTSANMNINEVLANRAGEILGDSLGNYAKVHPNDHVNRCQSTNDVFPSAGKLAARRLLDRLIPEIEALIEALEVKAEEYKDIIKPSRTQLQDAVPMRLGQSFAAWAQALKRDVRRLHQSEAELAESNLGGTAIGNSINASREYLLALPEAYKEVTGYDFVPAADQIDATQNLDVWLAFSGNLRALAATLNKMASDLRLLASGPRAGLSELFLPARQNGSSIMPGKVNPVIPEVVNQVAFNVFGNDLAIAHCVANGQLELNAFEPLLFHRCFDSLDSLRQGIWTFRKHCIEGLEPNLARLEQEMDHSLQLVTSLVPVLGYKAATKIALHALQTGQTIFDAAQDLSDLKPEELKELLDPAEHAHPASFPEA